MRILYVVDNWPGLFEAYLFREIAWMRTRGHHVAVASLGTGGPHGFRDQTNCFVELSRFGLEDLPVLQLDSGNMSEAGVLSALDAFARRHEVELMDAHLAREPAEVACAAHLTSGIPYSVRMRGGDVHSNPSPKLARILAHAAAVCPMSQFLADVLVGKRTLKKIPPGIPAHVEAGKIRVAPNSLPASYLAATAAEQSDDHQVIGAIGRIVPIKRFQDLVTAAAGLAADFPGLKVLIVGGGIAAPELQEAAIRAGISSRFQITGFKRWQEVIALAGRLHIYVQSSQLEGCSLATLEAAFQGIPLVLSRTGANEQCVESGRNGYLFEPGDVESLRENLRALLVAGADRRREMGAASLELVGTRFRAENVLPQIEGILQAAIDGRNSASDYQTL